MCVCVWFPGCCRRCCFDLCDLPRVSTGSTGSAGFASPSRQSKSNQEEIRAMLRSCIPCHTAAMQQQAWEGALLLCGWIGVEWIVGWATYGRTRKFDRDSSTAGHPEKISETGKGKEKKQRKEEGKKKKKRNKKKKEKKGTRSLQPGSAAIDLSNTTRRPNCTLHHHHHHYHTAYGIRHNIPGGEAAMKVPK